MRPAIGVAPSGALSGAFGAVGTVLIARSAIAAIVSDGLTPTFAGTAAPSQTSRLS